MSKISEAVVIDWVKNKKRIQDRLNRINKRLRKYNKQKTHFELRLKLIKQYDDRKRQANDGSVVVGKPAEDSSIQS
jgi:hypothetical protein